MFLMLWPAIWRRLLAVMVSTVWVGVALGIGAATAIGVHIFGGTPDVGLLDLAYLTVSGIIGASLTADLTSGIADRLHSRLTNSDDAVPISKYTADVVAVTDDGKVLLIERDWPPYEGQWALPGGHVDPGETSRAAAARELAEETGVHVAEDELRQIGAFDRPDRDPRGRYVTVAYLARVPADTPIAAGDDARTARWWPLDSLPPLAFDHTDVINGLADATTHHHI
ncbi:NUDIX domain-containing protein [Streptomyces sp. NPDC007063]|uniref:NUDIX domain-containing protein n=1 Tax=Streptomyces sp. NPDC007063 TaxID=3364772 RepID=UPI00367B1D6B